MRSGGSMLGRMWRTRDPRARELPERARRSHVLLGLDREHGAAREADERSAAAAMPIAIMALVRLGPRKAASAIATIRNGMASIASVMRMMRPSTQPPA